MRVHQGEALALLALLLLAGCAAAGDETSDVAGADETAAASGRQAAVDEAERRLDEDGGEDDDALVAEALAAHGFGAPASELHLARGLRALLLEVAAQRPRDGAGALYAATLARWHELATQPRAALLQAVATLAGFDPAAAPVLCDPPAAQGAASAPESGLDARERRQVSAARALVAGAISAHADLPLAEARTASAPVEACVREQATRAALAFASTRCASPADPALAAARALRRGWQSFTHEGFDDLAWPAVAALLGRPLPPPPAPARPALALESAAGFTCAALPAGLLCDGTTSGAPLRLSLDGRPLSVPLGAGLSPSSALARVRAALPWSLASCASGTPATLLRLDHRAPSLDGTALETVTIEPAQPADAARRPAPPRDLHVHGRFKSAGLRPSFFVDFSGCELRVELIALPVAGAPRDFDARVSLSSRLPARAYEALLTDELGRTLAAVDAN